MRSTRVAALLLLPAGIVVAGLIALGASLDGVSEAAAPPAEVQDADAARAADEPRPRAFFAEAADWWVATEVAASSLVDNGQWFQAIGRITDPAGDPYRRYARASHLGPIEERILEAAGRESKCPDEPLRGVFLRARLDLRHSGRVKREVAERAVAWASARALLPYASDVRRFARAYREVRFDDGVLDAKNRALVQRLEFADAAKVLLASRPVFETWCFERRVLDKAEELVALQGHWDEALADLSLLLLAGGRADVAGLLEAPAERVVLDPRAPVDATGFTLRFVQEGLSRTRRRSWTDPDFARVARSVILPRLPDFDAQVVLGLARVFTEVGVADAATACLDDAEPRVVADLPHLRPVIAALRREVAALGTLSEIAGGRIPSQVREDPRLEAWLQAHGETDVAATLGGLRARDLGALDAAAVDAYLAGGILWAPEQWRVLDARLAGSTLTKLDGRDAFQVECEHFSVVTDVSPQFAAEASLVLDAAYEQTALCLGLKPVQHQRAVIYQHERDYRRRFANNSGGCWSSSAGTLYCYLDQPSQRGFATFDYPTLLHEAAHAALGTSFRRHPPSWLHESVACYFERWNPARSVRANEDATGLGRRRDGRIRAAMRTNELPPASSLYELTDRWDIDDMGPRTLLHYAMAEALMVHLMRTPGRRAHVDRFLGALREGKSPSEALTKEERDALDASWLAFVTRER